MTTPARIIQRAAVALARGTDARIITAGHRHRGHDACALLHAARESNRHYVDAWWRADRAETVADYVAALRAVAGLAGHWARARMLTATAAPSPAAAARNAALVADEYKHRCRVACIPGANGAPPTPPDWLKIYDHGGTAPTVA